MFIGRIIIPAIVTLGVTGSILVGSAVPTVVTQVPTANVVAAAPYTYMHA